MAMPAHLKGTDELGGMAAILGTPSEAGGAGDMSDAKMRSIGRWMDDPALKTGQYRNHLAGGKPVHPSNHNSLRHNPPKVGAVYSGNGTVDPGARNIARVHKIQDVFNNSMPVDGWNITKKMRVEAEGILQHVRENQALPEKLPAWVDERGPLAKAPKMLKNSGTLFAIESAPKAGVALKALGATATVAVAALAAHEMETTEQMYDRSEIAAAQRGERHGQTVGAATLGCGGAWVGALMGSPAGPVGMLVGGIVGGACGSVGGGELGKVTLGRGLGGMYQAEEDRVTAGSVKFFRGAGQLTLPPEAYRGIGLGPAAERALANGK